MSASNMPLSPAPSNNGDLLQHGLHHIAQHNANSPYPQEKYQNDEGVHLHGSPAPGYDNVHHGQPARYAYQQHQRQDSGLGIHYDPYIQDYQAAMYQEQYSTPASSPPTPSMNGQGAMRTRSGHVIHHNLRPMPEPRSRVTSSPNPKKTKKEKVKAEKKVAKLEKPLSELTKDWKHVPVVDIEAYVNRSAEERRREVEEGKVPGKVKRPMNSFMLYRKAYQNRTKDWCLQNNHQIVSQVCGDSWPLEPEEVKEQFNEWARIERQNHQNAHPGYKFSPSKPGTSKAAKRKVSEEPMTEDSDLDDFDWGGPQSRRSKKQRPVPRPDAPVAYPTTRSAYNYSSRDNSVEPSNDGFHKSSWQYSNPGRSVPAQYNQAGLGQGQYYQQSTQNNHNMPGAKVEDVIIRKATVPGVHSFVPGGHQFDMMNPYSQFDLSQEQHRHDPSLGHGDYTYGEHHPDGVFFGESHSGDHHWHGSHNMIDRHRYDPTLNYIDPELDNMQIHDQHAGALRGNQDGWHVESLHEGQEFDKWMDEE